MKIMKDNISSVKVSVCIVCFNQEKYIEKCLESILGQITDYTYEVIIADDGSVDETRKIIKKYQSKYNDKIRIFFHEKNLGALENFRFAHYQANGEYIAHVDGDDYWLPGKLDKQIRALESMSAENCVACFTNSIVVNEIGEKIGKFASNVKNKFGKKYLLKDGNFLQTSSMLYKSHLRSDIFPKDNNFIDFYLYTKLISFGEFYYIDEELSAYRYGSDGSISENQRSKIDRLYCLALAEQKMNYSLAIALLQSYSNFTFRVFANSLVKGKFRNFIAIVKQIYNDRGSISTISVILGFMLIVVSRLLKKIIENSISAKAKEKIYFKK